MLLRFFVISCLTLFYLIFHSYLVGHQELATGLRSEGGRHRAGRDLERPSRRKVVLVSLGGEVLVEGHRNPQNSASGFQKNAGRRHKTEKIMVSSP